MRIRDVMHEPALTCTPSTTLAQAAHAMAVAEVGALVVVDDQKRLVGMVTDRDLVLRGYAHSLPADTAVSTVMTHGAATSHVDDDAFEASSTMAARGVRRLPVLDGDVLVGVISLDDLSILLGHEMADIGRAVAAQADTRHYAGWAGWD